MRRAWIEILWAQTDNGAQYVALHAEGVDRNCDAVFFTDLDGSRPPCGGRG